MTSPTVACRSSSRLRRLYAAAAYLILPRAIRLAAHILNGGRVPSYTLTGDGLPGDPVNLVLIGAVDELRRAFLQAGWTQADPLSVGSSWKMACAFVLNRPYLSAPFSTLYLFNRAQDAGFQRSIDDSPRKRHHVRFWALSIERAEKTLDTAAFWLAASRPGASERCVWVGAATKDVGLSLTRLSFQITHATDADTNVEREFLLRELTKHGGIGPVRYHRAGQRAVPRNGEPLCQRRLGSRGGAEPAIANTYSLDALGRASLRLHTCAAFATGSCGTQGCPTMHAI